MIASSSWAAEPVRIVGAAEVLIGAIGGLAIALGADPEITAAALAVASAAVGTVTAVAVRERVSPVVGADGA